MSGAALFANTAPRNNTKNLVEFKAGKMFMIGKTVYADPRKGQLYVHQSDDTLMHLCWKDRTTGSVEDDYILFPDDCEFKHVPQCKTGRVYFLRFKSSKKKKFFWLQNLKADKDEENCRKLNEVLSNPPIPGSQRNGNPNSEGDLQNLLNNMSQQQLMQLFGGPDQINLGNLLGTMNRPQQAVQSTKASTTTASTQVKTNTPRPATQTSSSPSSTNETPKSNGDTKQSTKTSTPTTSGATSASGTNNKIQLSDIQNILSDIPPPVGAEIVVQRGVATELTDAIRSAVTASESLERELRPHLPPGDQLRTTLLSPQFSQALSMFWSALQSGQAGPVVQQFGLGPDAVDAAASGNIEEFLNALDAEAECKAHLEEMQRIAEEQEDTNTKQTSPTSSPDKKDDDEGMALD